MSSRKQETQSNEEQDGLNIGSVYDFLYYDARRIASFLSQFDSSGNLREIVLHESVHDSKQSTGKGKVGGGVPLMASGEGEYSRGTSEARELGNQRIYDPIWTNARAFLDFLDEYNMIQRNVVDANMGQFVLCSGSLTVVNLQLIEKTWRLPSVQALAKEGAEGPTPNRQQRSAKNREKSTSNPELDLVMDILSILPHTIQAKLSGDVDVWCSLAEDGMSTLASDITLKHGTSVPGIWHALGVLDAKLDHYGDDEASADMLAGEEIAANLMVMLGPLARRLVGRPEDHYAITPLLIFREVVPKEMVSTEFDIEK